MYERFAILLAENGLSTYRFSKETGIPQTTLSSWKTGNSTLKVDKLEKIADYFHVSIDWLLGKTDDRNGYAGFEVHNSTSKQKYFAPKELKKLLEDEEITLNGRLMTDEDKQKMYKIIEAAFWDAKEMNKRKKSVEIKNFLANDEFKIKE